MINLKIDVNIPDLEIDLTCPNCNKNFKVLFKKLKPNSIVTCPHCKSSIKITGDDLSKIQKELESFARSLSSSLK